MKATVLVILILNVFTGQIFPANDSLVEEVANINIIVFNGGKIICNDLSYFTHDKAYDNQQKTLNNSVFVIQHPKGNLVWDSGIADFHADEDNSKTGNYQTFIPIVEKKLITQFADAGINIDSIDYISFSHTHFDHIGNAAYFSNSNWIVQEDELKWAFSKFDIQERELISPLKDTKKIIFKNSYDIFKDGTVMIYFYPGHTPGHCCLCVNTGIETILISGDMYHFKEQRTHKRIPQFNYDVEASEKSMEAFEKFAKMINARVIIQHEPVKFGNVSQ